MPSMHKTRVLIVDDSASVRQALTRVLSSDPSIEVIGAVGDPYAAVEAMSRQVPDVITLDVEMPRMDGLTFLEKMMSQRPIPTIICSTLTESGSEMALRALELGAVEVVAKPTLGSREFFQHERDRLCDLVKYAARARVRNLGVRRSSRPAPKLTADAVLGVQKTRPMLQTTEKAVVVGASTGGTEALKDLLMAMPGDSPGIVIVQHMPETFTARFAQRLDQECPMTVKEAADGDTVIRGRALIAPGNRHTLLRRSGARYYVELNDGPLVNRHRPSVDVLFRSAAQTAGRNAVGVILTGMGDDGARGMLELKEAGAVNLAQDEDSCVVFGMPAEAIKLGGVHHVVPLSRMAAEVLRLAKG
jgi:two-component system, chemotaxis family, protein-glutamate methylesterase/glutaminase